MQKDKDDSVEVMKLMQRNLVVRLLASAVMIPAVILITYIGGALFSTFFFIIAFALSREWLRMTLSNDNKTIHTLFYLTLFGAFTFTLLDFDHIGIIYLFLMPVLFYGVLRYSRTSHAILVTYGLPYIYLPIMTSIWIRSADKQGFLHFIFLVCVVAAADSGAYFAGKFFKGPKLAPSISPNKTISGAIGGVVFAYIIATLMIWLTGYEPPFVLFILVFLLAVASQIGDLFESFIKRKFNVKDSGGLIPGHGGALDRFDGYLFAIPVMAFILFVTS